MLSYLGKQKVDPNPKRKGVEGINGNKGFLVPTNKLLSFVDYTYHHYMLACCSAVVQLKRPRLNFCTVHRCQIYVIRCETKHTVICFKISGRSAPWFL